MNPERGGGPSPNRGSGVTLAETRQSPAPPETERRLAAGRCPDGPWGAARLPEREALPKPGGSVSAGEWAEAPFPHSCAEVPATNIHLSLMRED